MCFFGFMEEKHSILSLGKKLLIAAIALISLQLFIPKSQTIAAMYLIPTIAQNEKIQEIGGNSLSILQELTRQWLEELAKGKEPKKI